MRKLFTLLMIVFISAGLKAQNYQLQNVYDFYRLQMRNEKLSEPGLTENNIEGSPYDSKEFREGYLVTVTNQKYVGLFLRYNIFNDRIEYRDEAGNPMAIAYPEAINHVVIGSAKYIYSPYAVQKKVVKGFFRVAEEGRASLFIRKNIGFQEAQPAAAYKDPEPPKFLKKPDDFYIRIEPSEAKLISNKSDLPLAFPDKNDQIDEFIKKNKIKANREEDLAKLVRFYNSLP